MPAIVEVRAREILDSRGNPTVEVDVRVEGGAMGRAAVPSGASTGAREALELRDGDARRYGGKGVLRAVAHVRETIAPAVRGMDAAEQEALDRRLCDLDGTPNKARLGSNAVLGVSLAAARAAAEAAGLPLYRHLGGAGARTLPVPLMNVINGGVHADNDLDVQEFMLAPIGPPTFAEALRAGVETFHALKALLRGRGQSTAVGDEGGFAPDLGSPEAALDALVEAIGRAGYRPGRDVALALDCAASELRADGGYRLQGERLSATALIDRYAAWIDRYPIVSIEDGLSEDDWEGWRELHARLGGRIQIVADDLLCTNLDLLRRGIAERAANAILVKVNQIGTLTEALGAVRAAREAGWGQVISHRSGETEDTLVADLAVGAGTGQIKTGSASRSDRVAKYNRLLRIAEEIGEGAVYPGGSVFARGG